VKKLFSTILVLGLILVGNAYAKIDKSYVNQIYDGCISDSKQNNDYNSDSKKFCKCYANEFNKKFDNAGLMEFMNKSGKFKALLIQKEIAPPCYPLTKKNKSKQTNNNKTNISCINSKDGSSKQVVINHQSKIIYLDDQEISDEEYYGYSVEDWNDKKIYVKYTLKMVDGWKANHHLTIDRISGVMMIEILYSDGDYQKEVYNCKSSEAAKF